MGNSNRFFWGITAALIGVLGGLLALKAKQSIVKDPLKEEYTIHQVSFYKTKVSTKYSCSFDEVKIPLGSMTQWINDNGNRLIKEHKCTAVDTIIEAKDE